MNSIVDFNQQLRNILDAKVPLLVGGCTSRAAIRSVLDQIDQAAQRPVNQNETDEALLDSLSVVDEGYRIAYRKWKQTGDLVASAETLYGIRVVRQDIGWGLQRFALPLFLLLLIMLPAFLFLQQGFYRHLSSFYVEQKLPSSVSLEVLGWMNRNNFVCYGLLPAILLCGVVFLWGPRWLAGWLTGVRNATVEDISMASHPWYRLVPLVASSLIAGSLVLVCGLLTIGALAQLIQRLSVPVGEWP
jgi:hypothetical protein